MEREIYEETEKDGERYMKRQREMERERELDTYIYIYIYILGARCSSVVGAFAHGAMGRRIDPSWGGPIELFIVPVSAPRLV